MTRLPIYIVIIIYVKTVFSSKFETVDIGTTEFGSKFDKIPSRFNFLDSVIKLKIHQRSHNRYIDVHIIGTHHASSKSAEKNIRFLHFSGTFNNFRVPFLEEMLQIFVILYFARFNNKHVYESFL